MLSFHKHAVKSVIGRADAAPAPPPGAHICVAIGCAHETSETWDECGSLCGDCWVENELFDRESRRERVFPIQ